MSQAGSSNQRDPRVPDSTRLQGAGDERLVSIIVPCRNERGHIDAFLDSATAQQLQAGWRMEILVADGESDDGTGERIQARAAVDARLVPVANPGRIVSTGLNACLARARGAVIVRMDVHTQFAPDYVAHVGQLVKHSLPRSGRRFKGLCDDHTITPFHPDGVSLGGCVSLVVKDNMHSGCAVSVSDNHCSVSPSAGVVASNFCPP